MVGALAVCTLTPMTSEIFERADESNDGDGPDDPKSTAAEKKASNIELFSVLLIALTAVLTAWSGFQSSKWGGVMSIEFSAANAARTESVRMSNQANQQTSIDVGLFVNYVSARASEDEDLADFLLERMPERLAVATDAWLETKPLTTADAPKTPFEMVEYVVPAMEKADDLGLQADDHSDAARDANQTGDNYTITSVFFASVILLAALSTKVDSERLQKVLLATAVIILIATSAVIAAYPIEI